MTETMFPIENETMSALRDRLVRSAEAAELIDVAYRTFDSPIGPLLLAATPAGLVRVAFLADDMPADTDAPLTELATRISPRVLLAPARLDPAARQLEEYFAGHRNRFDLPLDLSLSAGFRRTVQQFLPHIAYGSTMSYGEVARGVGNPRAVRAVGTACATNPLPVVVPCHRVVRTDGSLGNYAGGVEAKKTLLRLEAS